MLIKIHNDYLLGQKPILSPTSGVWIAGGAIRQWFVGEEKASDIDVFASSEEKIKEFISAKMVGAEKAASNDRLESFIYSGQIIQCIKYKYFATAEELIDSFDFNVCRFVWDGVNVYAAEDAIIGTLRKTLSVHKITEGLEADSLRRAFKYQRKGYTPCWGTIKALAQCFSSLSKEKIEEQVQISLGGGTRFVGVD